MKLTELILKLHTIMLEKGNLHVYVRDYDRDWGIFEEVPEVEVVDDKVYLN